MTSTEIVQQVIQEMDAELVLPQHRSLRQSVKIADWKTRLAALSSSPSESTRKPLQMPTDPEWYRRAAEREEANGDADCTVGSDAVFTPHGSPTIQPEEERTAPITVDDLDNLRHMLGVSETNRRGYRNYFIAGSKDVASMERLRALGFVVKNERYKLSSDPCYNATIDGARAVGLRELPA